MFLTVFIRISLCDKLHNTQNNTTVYIKQLSQHRDLSVFEYEIEHVIFRTCQTHNLRQVA